MNIGKTLFAQVMEFVPCKTFGRVVQRHRGDAGVRTLNCADLFRVMVFAQLTWRQSLRNIEVCLSANRAKLFHMGLNNLSARSTLSDALNLRDRRIYHDLAIRMIAQALALSADERLNLDLDASVYALEATTIDLCLALFDWAPFRSTKAAIKLHTLLDFLPIEAGAFYVMDRGYLDFARLYKMHPAGAFFVTRAKRSMDARRVYSQPSERSTGVICDQAIALNGFYVSKHYPEHLRIKKFLGTSENAVKTQIWCAVCTYGLIAIVKKKLHLNARCTHCYRFFPSRFSRNPSCHAPCSSIWRSKKCRLTLTN